MALSSNRDPLLKLRPGEIAPREEPACKGVVDGRMQPVSDREFRVLVVELAHHQVVDDLRHHRSPQAPFFAKVEHLEDLPRAEIRDAPRANLPDKRSESIAARVSSIGVLGSGAWR